MAGTRSSARNAGNNNSSSQSANNTNGNKRKAESSPETAKSKRGKKSAPKQQKTIEQTLPDAGAAEPETQDQDQPQDIEMKEAASGGDGTDAKPDSTPMPDGANKKDAYKRPDGCWFWLDGEKYAKAVKGEEATGKKTMNAGDSFKGKNKEGEPMSDPEKALKESRGGAGINVMDESQKSSNQGKNGSHEDVHEESTEPAHHENGTKGDDKNNDTVEESKQRADAMPSNILEKGVIYFFTRGRVSVDEPESVQDLQRSYFVLRPLPTGAKLNDGAIPDASANRLLALPKKVWPKSGKDKFMVFVEQAKTSMQELKDSFFQGSEYSTKTTGTRQQHPVTPLGEGVYAITTTGDGRESHLAYMLTIPREPGEMQEDVGIRAKGSFVMSLKNPTVKGPANASLPQGPDWPKEFIDAFRGRGWMPAEPKHLDYANAQVLLIGEDIEASHALDATAKDEKSEQKETPKEAIEELEHEDELRVEHLKGDDTIFADLGISSKDYPSVPTTW